MSERLLPAQFPLERRFVQEVLLVDLDGNYVNIDGSGGGSTDYLTGDFNIVTDSGTISAGAQSVAIANIGDADGLVNGKNLPAGLSLNWSGDGVRTLTAFTYDATGTTFVITEVR